MPSADTRRVFVQTLGCKLNQYDSEMLLTQLRAEGYRDSESPQNADLIVVNTCAVTDIAERKGRAAIRAALRQNPDAEVVATGCQAERSPESLLRAGAHKVIGNREKEHFLSAIGSDLAVVAGGVRKNEPWSDGTMIHGLTGRTRAFLKVQDGCSQHCTYCIVPQLRGRGRSLAVSEAVDRARKLVDHGVKEIVVTGVALGTYGFDSGSTDQLPDLIQALSSVCGSVRLRLGSVEPWAVTERFLDIVANSDNVCPHLHLPFQSACDDVLHRMNRRYTVKHLNWILEYAFSLRSDWGIGADIIVGFPGETREQFLETKRYLEESPIASLHVFPFSSRPGTSAEKLGNRVKRAEADSRADELRVLSRTLREEFHQKQIGTQVECIVEQRGSDHFVFGHARNYADVALPRGTSHHGALVRATVQRADADFLYCN